MIDYYLRFSSQEDAFAALKEAGYTQIFEDKEVIITATHEYCVDEIGDIYTGGEWGFDENGNPIVIQEPTKLNGWHINIRIIRGDIAENLLSFVIPKPQTPYRVFG